MQAFVVIFGPKFGCPQTPKRVFQPFFLVALLNSYYHTQIIKYLSGNICLVNEPGDDIENRQYLLTILTI